MSHLVTACNTSDRSGPGYCLHPWLRVCPEIWMEVTPTTFKHVLTMHEHQDQDVIHLEDDLPGLNIPGGHQHPPAPLLEVDVVVESHNELLGVSQTRTNAHRTSSKIL